MFDTKEQILHQLLAGEDGYAEFKEVRFEDRGVLSPNTEELAGELVAVANAEGGWCFLELMIPARRAGFHLRNWMRWSTGFSTLQPTIAVRPFGRSSARRYCGAQVVAMCGFC